MLVQLAYPRSQILYIYLIKYMHAEDVILDEEPYRVNFMFIATGEYQYGYGNRRQ